MMSEGLKNGNKAVHEKAEIRLHARSVSRGVAIGRIVTLHGKNRQFFRVEISDSEIPAEVDRLRAAVRNARRQLDQMAQPGNRQTSPSMPGIFDAQRMMLDDSSFISKVESEIAEKKINCEWSVKLVADEYVAKYKAIPDEHLSERYIDIEDVAERILVALGIGGQPSLKLNEHSIIAASELLPSTLAELNERSPKAVITEHGGWTSHTFILARELSLPAVTGLKKLLRVVNTGDPVIVDGYNGQIILHPTPETLDKYKVAAAQFQQINYDHIDVSNAPPKTLDGTEIIVRANLDIPAVYRKARRFGARGIGLYRSEFLFNRFKGFPSESEQVHAYREIADFAGEDGVTIRTFDLGTEQLYGQANDREKNPALGLRAIRLSLSQTRNFRVQLRSLLRASHERTIDILIPMISGVAEVRQIKSLLEAERKRLAAKNIPFGDPRLGIMIEVPSTVFIIKELAEEIDFMCLGTNDLVQYLLAVDRDNEAVANWFRTLHPAVIRAIKMVIDDAAAAGKPLVICGEMAGSAFYVPLLLGLGAKELSMNVNSIVRVRKMISGIAFEEARDLAARVIKCKTADEIEAVINEQIGTKWAHLFPSDLLSSRRI